MRRVLLLLPAVWLVALLLLPAGAWVLGARQATLENRPQATFPAINRGTLRNEATFTQLGAAFTDRLPLREHAIEARGRIAVDLFHDSPNADVAIGSDSWLYYRPELRACTDEGRPGADPADAADLLARTLVATGRTAGVLVAGSKVVTHDAHLPRLDGRLLACVRRLESRVQGRLARTPGGLDVQPTLRALERQGRPTFLRTDTHWNATGREVFVRAVLDRIRPGLSAAAGIRRGPTIDRPGDLGPFLGLKRSERDPTVVATRTPRRPLPAGEVLLIGDSQLDRALLTPIGAPSLRDVVLPGQASCTWDVLAQGPCDEPLRAAKTVVTEIVGRNVSDLVNTCWRPIAVTAASLRGRAGAWERTDGQPQQGRRLVFDASGRATARVRTAGPDVRAVPRLLRLPVATLPAAAAGAPAAAVALEQRPQAGPAAPCATPSQTVQGGALFLPVPAGRRASDLLASLTAPAGTVLGAPEELVLDGRRVRTRP